MIVGNTCVQVRPARRVCAAELVRSTGHDAHLRNGTITSAASHSVLFVLTHLPTRLRIADDVHQVDSCAFFDGWNCVVRALHQFGAATSGTRVLLRLSDGVIQVLAYHCVTVGVYHVRQALHQ